MESIEWLMVPEALQYTRLTRRQIVVANSAPTAFTCWKDKGEKGMAHRALSSAEDSAVLDTELVDLSEYSVEDTMSIPACQLALYLNRALDQVGMPRMNLGGSGPPGRVD